MRSEMFRQLTLVGEDFGNEAAGTTADILVYFRDHANNILLASGTDVPTDDTTGYAKGCRFIVINVAGGTGGTYENVGTTTSCNFDVIGTVAAGTVEATDIEALANGEFIIGVDGDAANNAKVTASGDVTLTNDGEILITSINALATAAEVNAICDGDGNYVVTAAATAAVTMTAAQSGKTFILPNFDAACTFDLPAEADGLYYKFVYAGGAEDAHGIIIDSESDTNFFIGGVAFLDVDAGDAADEVNAGVYSDGDSNSKITCATVGAGTIIELKCDGTNWYIWGTVIGATAPAFADQA